MSGYFKWQREISHKKTWIRLKKENLCRESDYRLIEEIKQRRKDQLS